ncbi:hypothetical protein [Paenibacillus sp. HJGM_3]|uniref:hypothetical protein n=1 Tax=Paenibacillus sp. HJGM_3 TaxID=3379816 RepID=UPI00385B08BF
MYPKVVVPKKITRKWLDQAFAPLRHYLERHSPEKAQDIMGFLMFMGNNDGKFYYKNSITRDAVIFDQEGKLLYCSEASLQHKFDWGYADPDPAVTEDPFTHPNVEKWMRTYLKKRELEVYGKEIRLFLQHLWGPVANYDFSDLTVGYPFGNKRFRQYLYIYPAECPARIAFLFPGEAVVTYSCEPEVTRTYRRHEFELQAWGYRIMTILIEGLERDMHTERRVLERLMETAAKRE